MTKFIAVMIAVLALGGCYDKGSSDTSMSVNTAVANPIYESGNLGSIEVTGIPVESQTRFTMNSDEFIVAVHLEANYIPYPGNLSTATAEMTLYDSQDDQNPNNDILIGQLSSSSPWSRGRLSAELPGSFSIIVPLGAGTSLVAGPTIQTLGVHLKINSNGWNGIVTDFRYKIVTMKNCKTITAPDSFIRDQ